jgi:hypothetical protein
MRKTLRVLLFLTILREKVLAVGSINDMTSDS